MYDVVSIPNEFPHVKRANIEWSIRQQFACAKVRRPKNARPVAVIGGGPSINDRVDEIRKMREDGHLLVSLNATHDWLIDKGLPPDIHVQLEARRSAEEFVKNSIEDCRYYIASQSAPEVFRHLMNRRLLLFHVQSDNQKFLDQYYGGPAGLAWYPISGGSTVGTKVFHLLSMLGITTTFRCFGYDSSMREDDHHAYEQSLNDGKAILNVSCAGKKFRCQPWMWQQSIELKRLLAVFRDKLLEAGHQPWDVEWHCDGLVPTVFESESDPVITGIEGVTADAA